MSKITYKQIEQTLEIIRPKLINHGGDIEIIGINSDNVLLIRLVGSCSGCKDAQYTFNIIKRTIKEHLPKITNLHAIL